MANLTISSAASLTGATTASGDLFPCLDVSAASGSQGSKITRDELGDAMTRTAAMIAALAAKLDLAGGTMTGALTLPAGSVSAPSLLLTGAGSTTGVYSTGSGSIDIAIAGVRRYWFDGNNLNTSGTGLQVTNGNIIGTFAYLRTNTGGVLSLGASDDVKLGRGGAAATLQIGVDHATTPTEQTFKAHNVTTGTGAALKLCGGTGSDGKGAVFIGDATDMPAGFHGYSCPQAGAGGAAVSFVENIGTTVNEQSTFGGYTLGQVVFALQQKGILA